MLRCRCGLLPRLAARLYCLQSPTSMVITRSIASPPSITTAAYFPHKTGIPSTSNGCCQLRITCAASLHADAQETSRRESLKQSVSKLREQLDEQRRQLQSRIFTVPNALCVLRIGLTPIVGCLVVYQYFIPAFSIFLVAGITDLLDGFIARHVRGQSSLLGSILDPIADKLLVSTLFVTLTYVSLIPLLLTSIVLLRDVSLIVGGTVKRYRTLEPPFSLKRFFDLSVSPVRVAPTLVSKVNTALQLSLVALSLASPVFDFVGHPGLLALGVATGATTIYSGMQYVFLDRMNKVE